MKTHVDFNVKSVSGGKAPDGITALGGWGGAMVGLVGRPFIFLFAVADILHVNYSSQHWHFYTFLRASYPPQTTLSASF